MVEIGRVWLRQDVCGCHGREESYLMIATLSLMHALSLTDK